MRYCPVSEFSAKKVIMSDSKTDLFQTPVSKQLDSRGMACPYPSFETVKALSAMTTGQCIEIITDSDESALKSIPNVCRKRNWNFIVRQESDSLWRLRIMK
jgi:TusA-related sulfurtransferase